MLEGLLKRQIQSDEQIEGMLTAYNRKPAFFYQKSPPDVDSGWEKFCYPRVDYNIDMQYSPERKINGILTINVWCSSQSEAMPEDIEKRLRELIEERENAIAALDDAYGNIVVGLELKAEIDSDFNIDEEMQKLTAQYQEDASRINDRYIDVQMEYAVKLFEAEDYEILPNLEGDLLTRIKTAIEAAVAVTDPVEWDSASWLRIMDLKEGAHNEELAGELSNILSPIAQTMHENFLKTKRIAIRKNGERPF